MDSVLAEQKDGGIPIVRIQRQQLGAQGVGGHINAGGIPPHRKNTVHPCIRNVPELLPAIGLIDNVHQAIYRNRNTRSPEVSRTFTSIASGVA